MVSFFVLGCIITIGSLIFFLFGLLDEGQFLFGPFLASVIGINFLLISYIQVKRERLENKGRRTP